MLPAISAGAAKRMTCQKGKFHGMIASTVPSGLERHVALGGARLVRLVGEKLGGCSA